MPYKNIEDKRKQSKKYYREHKEERKVYYQKNKERIEKKHKEWLIANPEKKKQYSINGKEKAKQWRKTHPEKIAKSMKKRRQEKKKFVDDYKLSKGCAICGYNKCAEALHFHHENEKEFSIGKAVSSNMNNERMLIEMIRCVILCANCHIEEHNKIRKEKENEKI